MITIPDSVGPLISIAAVVAAAGGTWALTKSAADEAKAKVSKVAEDLTAFKLDVAKQYATSEMLVKVEERIVSSIDRLGDRLDRVLERSAD